MFNAQTLNSQPINSGSIFLEGSAVSVLDYNGYSFSTDSFVLNRLSDIENLGNINYNTFDIANAHGRSYDSLYHKSKTITIQGTLKGSSQGDLDTVISTLKKTILQPEKVLRYKKSNEDIIYTVASCTTLNVRREKYHIDIVPVTIVFTTVSPFFYSLIPNEASFRNLTTSLTGSITNVGGSFEARPNIIVQFKDVPTLDQTSGGSNGTTSLSTQGLSIASKIGQKFQMDESKYVLVKHKLYNLISGYNGDLRISIQGDDVVEGEPNGTEYASVIIPNSELAGTPSGGEVQAFLTFNNPTPGGDFWVVAETINDTVGSLSLWRDGTPSANAQRFRYSTQEREDNNGSASIRLYNATDISGVTQLEVTLGDDSIELNRSYETGDVVQIDSKNYDVIVNGVSGNDYTGILPSLPIGETPIEVIANGTYYMDVLVVREYYYV